MVLKGPFHRQDFGLENKACDVHGCSSAPVESRFSLGHCEVILLKGPRLPAHGLQLCGGDSALTS